MQTPVHTETIDGYRIDIYNDEDFESDFIYDNDDVFAVTKDTRYFHLHGPGMKWSDLPERDDEEAWQELEKKYAIFDLYAYVHSGVAFSLSGFSCQWDSGQAGYVFVRRDAGWVDKEGDHPGAALERAAESFVREVNDVHSGNVYGFSVSDEDDVEDGTCWGFVGDYDSDHGALSAAREEVDFWVKKRDSFMKKVRAVGSDRLLLKAHFLLRQQFDDLAAEGVEAQVKFLRSNGMSDEQILALGGVR